MTFDDHDRAARAMASRNRPPADAYTSRSTIIEDVAAMLDRMAQAERVAASTGEPDLRSAEDVLRSVAASVRRMRS